MVPLILQTSLHEASRIERLSAQLLLLAAIVLWSKSVFAVEALAPTATPYRPSVSSPATLPAPGWLDMEFGWQYSKGGEDQRLESFPVTAKLAFSDKWGVMVNAEMAVQRTDFSDQRFTGVGDTAMWLQHRIPASESSAWGVALGINVPTAKDSIGSGHSDKMLNLIYSADVSDSFHLDVNVVSTRIGTIGTGEGRMQYALASAQSYSFNDKWSAFVEPSTVYRKGTETTSQILVGGSYAHSKRVVFDMAIARRISSAGPDWQFMAGITWLAGKVW